MFIIILLQLKKSSYIDCQSIFNYKSTISPSHISSKQEACLKAKNVEAICDDYESSVYQAKNLQSTANKVCFPENGAKYEIDSKPLKNQDCIAISVSEDEMPKKKQQKTLGITIDTLQSLSKFKKILARKNQNESI